MRPESDIDGLLVTVLDRDSTHDVDRGREAALIQLVAAMNGVPRHAIRAAPRARTRRMIVLVAAAFVLVGGVAVGATTDIGQRILNSTDPASDRVESIRERKRSPISVDEISDLFANPTASSQVSERVTSAFGEPLVELPDTRLLARRGVDGAICTMVVQHQLNRRRTRRIWESNVAWCGSFEPGWPLSSGYFNEGTTGGLAHGLAADGVSTVRFFIDDQSFNATFTNGAFLWRYPDGRTPTAVEVVLVDGTIVRRDLKLAHEPDMINEYSDPYIVK